MSTSKEKFLFYLRIFLCLLIVVYWSVWLLTLPQPNKKKTKKRTHITATKKEPDPTPRTETIKKEQISKKTPALEKKTQPQITKNTIAKTELPKLANLEIKKSASIEEAKPVVKENKIPITKEKEQINISVDLNLPMTAGATREALLNKIKQPQINKDNSGLRGKVAIKKNSFKAQTKNLFDEPEESKDNDEFKESWLPKYFAGKDELKSKLESITKNLDSIANHLELTGIIKNPDGHNAAIIKNTETNAVEILQKGEEYKGLQLLEINNDEIILGSKGIDKIYTKKIINKGH